MVSKLTGIAALIGVVLTIGGVFISIGSFEERLSQMENKEFVVNETVDLSKVNADLSTLKETLGVQESLIKYLELRINELATKLDNPLLN
jgi:cob(I)alamin adenosyltransferase|tara:strand:- start:8270 stop:8539 length:270 start_codon:yes stop_codon:yes gene_type:complete